MSKPASESFGYCDPGTQEGLVNFLNKEYRPQLFEKQELLKEQQTQKDRLQSQFNNEQQNLKLISMTAEEQAKLASEVDKLTKFYEAVKKAKVAAQNWSNGKGPKFEKDTKEILMPYKNLF
ncbi:hypothetical protein [Candidatus Finniella inopinata]|uniref:Uncharacterized protein n=1 Tax=Candidatus Finniella inopinata TaxID=1696036 RepID=A0A4Q7DHN0_9PROT|nr:hypothetical protein [Candidatus Finniella inopinata]RZI45798.1 hypothetical protein EQU50_05015 [Candidatus Finniella inopinata]